MSVGVNERGERGEGAADDGLVLVAMLLASETGEADVALLSLLLFELAAEASLETTALAVVVAADVAAAAALPVLCALRMSVQAWHARSGARPSENITLHTGGATRQYSQTRALLLFLGLGGPFAASAPALSLAAA